jgi:hypothetical protein
MLRRGRWLAVLCIFALVAAALLAPATGGSTPVGILVPLAPLFGLVVIADVRLDDDAPVRTIAADPKLPSRAPPAQLSTL